MASNEIVLMDEEASVSDGIEVFGRQKGRYNRQHIEYVEKPSYKEKQEKGPLINL